MKKILLFLFFNIFFINNSYSDEKNLFCLVSKLELEKGKLALIDYKRFFKIEHSHFDFVMAHNLIVSPGDPHPSATGHSRWAEQLKEFIDANNLRTV